MREVQLEFKVGGYESPCLFILMVRLMNEAFKPLPSMLASDEQQGFAICRSERRALNAPPSSFGNVRGSSGRGAVGLVYP